MNNELENFVLLFKKSILSGRISFILINNRTLINESNAVTYVDLIIKVDEEEVVEVPNLEIENCTKELNNE